MKTTYVPNTLCSLLRRRHSGVAVRKPNTNGLVDIEPNIRVIFNERFWNENTKHTCLPLHSRRKGWGPHHCYHSWFCRARVPGRDRSYWSYQAVGFILRITYAKKDEEITTHATVQPNGKRSGGRIVTGFEEPKPGNRVDFWDNKLHKDRVDQPHVGVGTEISIARGGIYTTCGLYCMAFSMIPRS